MLLKRGWVYVAVILLFSISCNNTGDNRFNSAEDSVAFRMDSIAMTAGACQGSFFNDLERFADSTSAYLTVDSNKRVTLTQYFRDEFMSPVSSYGLKDLDGDGKKELIVYNNTGGAHCCDEFSIFGERSPEEYFLNAKLMGDACVSAETNVFTFSFNESLGYFFSCYACNFRDTTSLFKTMRALRLKYRGERLEVIPYSKNEEEQNLKNFAVLKSHGFEKLNGMMDNGWRKEYAINTAIWHFNHGRNWTTTKTIFETYYSWPDRPAVWKELYESISELSLENTF